MGQEFLRLATVGIVTVQDFTQDRFGPGVIALRDARFGQNGAAFANAFRRLVVRAARDDCVGQIGDGGLKFLVRHGVISRFHGGFASRKGSLALWYASLTPLHFALGDVIGVLREDGGR